MDVLDFPLSRLCYAAHTEDAVEVTRAGFAAWVGRQIDPKTRSDANLDGRLRAFKLQIKYAAGNGEPTPGGDTRNWPAMDEMRPLTYLDEPIATPWALLDSKTARPPEEQARPYHEVAAATVFRAAHSRAQLYEQVVAFWHDHFNVLASDDKRIGCALPSYDRDAIRPHALGNFRDLLESVAKSPAMLIYLSNASSRAGAANENYARELMELHTLGRDAYLNDRYDRWRDVPGASDGAPQGYIDEDVYEAARAFTGWAIENGQRLDGATELPRTGKVIYIGKANSLRNRVRSYFRKARHLDMKTLLLRSEIFDFEYVITASEREALNLEANLVRKHKPEYNQFLRHSYGSLLELQTQYLFLWIWDILIKT